VKKWCLRRGSIRPDAISPNKGGGKRGEVRIRFPTIEKREGKKKKKHRRFLHLSFWLPRGKKGEERRLTNWPSLSPLTEKRKKKKKRRRISKIYLIKSRGRREKKAEQGKDSLFYPFVEKRGGEAPPEPVKRKRREAPLILTYLNLFLFHSGGGTVGGKGKKEKKKKRKRVGQPIAGLSAGGGKKGQPGLIIRSCQGKRRKKRPYRPPNSWRRKKTDFFFLLPRKKGKGKGGGFRLPS